LDTNVLKNLNFWKAWEGEHDPSGTSLEATHVHLNYLFIKCTFSKSKWKVELIIVIRVVKISTNDSQYTKKKKKKFLIKII
jgi:hypothetical protein